MALCLPGIPEQYYLINIKLVSKYCDIAICRMYMAV